MLPIAFGKIKTLKNNAKQTKNIIPNPPQNTSAILLSMRSLLGNKISGEINRKTKGMSKMKNKLSNKAVIITIDVDLPKFIFSLFK